MERVLKARGEREARIRRWDKEEEVEGCGGVRPENQPVGMILRNQSDEYRVIYFIFLFCD